MVKGELLATACATLLLFSSGGSLASGDEAARGPSYCRYDLDVSRQPDARFVIGHLRGQRYTTCPFLDEQPEPVRIYVEDRGSGACGDMPIGGLSTLRITAITGSAHDQALASCLSGKSPQTEGAAAGKVYLLSASLGAHGDRDLAEIAANELALAGLPVSHLDTRTQNGTSYVCFEMMSGATMDPLAFLRSDGAKIPATTTQAENPAPTCRLAFKALGMEP